MKKGKTIIKIIWIIILLYNLLFHISNNFNPNKNLKIFKTEFIIIEDNSMSKELNENDIALIKRSNTLEIKVGDVVLYDDNGNTVIHRIAREKKNNNVITYVTKGDNNYHYDIEEITRENIKGVLIGKIPKMGSVIKILQSKIITVLALIYLILEYAKIIIQKNKKRKQKNPNM